MKAKLVRSDLDVAPSAFGIKRQFGPDEPGYGEEFLKAHTEPTGRKTTDGTPILRWKWGTILEHPDAWKMVRQGVAIPADEECGIAAGLTPKEIERAQIHYDKLLVDGSYMAELVEKASRPRFIDEDEE